MNLHTSKLAGFVVAAAICLLLYFVVFELRYMWYLKMEDASILRAGNIMVIVAITILWLIFPSRALIGVIALAGLVFPYFWKKQDFAPVDVTFAVIAFAVASLLVGVTQLRRYWFGG